jgi:SAM-dependent methyltransferase
MDSPTLDILSAPDCQEDTRMKELGDLYLKLQSGYDISRQEITRAKKEGRYDEVEGLGYGEVDVEAFGTFIRSFTSTHNQGIFLDLGSGSGKAVLSAAFSGMFSRCIGVEILEPLHRLAMQAVDHAARIDGDRAAIVRFELGDIFDKETLWSTADVLLVTCTLFTDDMMLRLDRAISRLVRPGSIVITTTRRLSNPRATWLTERRIKYAKGSLLFIVYMIK